MPCCCCEITDRTFRENDARDDLRSYHKHGPPAQTAEILTVIRSLGLSGVTLLDIGGGVGVIHHELLRDVAASATHVDASSAYLNAARQESDRLGHASRVTFTHADFVDVAPELPQADIVTLDRVVCCYPDFRLLLTAAARHTRHALGIAYPRDVWYMRAVIAAIDLLQRLRRDQFRVFMHPVGQMHSVLLAEGLQRVALKRLFAWEVAVYDRAAQASR